MTTNFLQAVEKLRVQIEDTRAEISWLDSSPIPSADLKACITEWVNRTASADDRLTIALQAMAAPDGRSRGDAGREMLQVQTRVDQSGGAVWAADIAMAPLLAWLFGDELTQRLHAKVDSLQYTPGPPLGERAQRRAALVKELRRLESEEEALICRAEAASVLIGRRADADPAVVLSYEPRGTMREGGRAGVQSPANVVNAERTPSRTAAPADMGAAAAPAAAVARGSPPAPAAFSGLKRLFR